MHTDRQQMRLVVQVALLFVVLATPSFIRLGFQRNDWTNYTDQRYGYTIDYPAHLWKKLSYAGFQGDREIHLLLTWPASIAITHQISIGEVGLENPSVSDVADIAAQRIEERNGQFLSELETIHINDGVALTRTYFFARKKYKEVYLTAGGRGYLLRFSAEAPFYESSLVDFERIVTSFRPAQIER